MLLETINENIFSSERNFEEKKTFSNDVKRFLLSYIVNDNLISYVCDKRLSLVSIYITIIIK